MTWLYQVTGVITRDGELVCYDCYDPIDAFGGIIAEDEQAVFEDDEYREQPYCPYCGAKIRVYVLGKWQESINS